MDTPQVYSSVRIAKRIFEVRKRGPFSSFDKNSEYVSNLGVLAGSEQRTLNYLKNLPIIEETKDKYPSEGAWDCQENYGWKWIGGDWRHDGADAWGYAMSVSFKNFPVEDSKWSRTFSMLHCASRRVIYRYAVKSNVTHEEIEWLKRNKYRVYFPDSELQSEIARLRADLTSEFKKVKEVTQKPNILLLGGSGAGKSSLVNAVFGKSLAEIGNGLPVTQTYKKFDDPEVDVVIYDSKGIEHGSIEDGFLEDTKQFFYKLRKDNPLTGHIHVVWYVIDLTQARFQPFEAEFCKTYLKDIPIIFVFNKADAVSKKTREIMIKTVADFNLKNCHGIYATVAQCKNFDRKDCPECESLRIRKRVKEGTCTILCKDCNAKTEMHLTEGIIEISRATINVLPKFVQSVFVNAQKSNLIFQEDAAKKLILMYAPLASFSKEKTFRNAILSMVDDITSMYKVGLIKEPAKTAIRRQLESYYFSASFFKRLSVKWTGYSAIALLIACGLEVCRNCIIFKEEVASLSLDEDVEESFIVHDVLAILNFHVDKEFVNQLIQELHHAGSVDGYLKSITIDGNFWSYLPLFTTKPPEERRKVEIILHPYQRRKPESEKPESEKPVSESTSQPEIETKAESQVVQQNTSEDIPPVVAEGAQNSNN